MMHKYSTDSSEQKTIPFFIAVVAIAASFLISKIFDYFGFVPPWWLSLPVDTMGLYGAFYWLFDHVIWKWKWIHVLRISHIPNLSGKWHGSVRSVKTDNKPVNAPSEVSIEITIKQTWTEILIIANTAQSKSHSISGNLVVTDDKILSYEYINEPVAGSTETMHAHRGTAYLIPDIALTNLTGEYYSGRDRQSIGQIVVKKK